MTACPHERIALDDEDLHPSVKEHPGICRDCGELVTLVRGLPDYDTVIYELDEKRGSTYHRVVETAAESLESARRQWDEERERESRSTAIREGIVLPKWAK